MSIFKRFDFKCFLLSKSQNVSIARFKRRESKVKSRAHPNWQNLEIDIGLLKVGDFQSSKVGAYELLKAWTL